MALVQDLEMLGTFLVMDDREGRWRQSAHEANEELTNENPENESGFGRSFRLIDHP